jgi:hypothetical protein
MFGERTRKPMLKLALAGAVAILAIQAAPTAALTGFGGPTCAQTCESLCNGQRLQCYNFCGIHYAGNQAAIDDCNWNCSLQMGTCRDICLEHC